jgi:predicted AlkP superfamily pyrophosphatase or phosphodiesterase
MFLIMLRVLIVAVLLLPAIVYASNPDRQKPKLIVGIVIDQMRYDYLTRYWEGFGDGGFKKLVREGFNCTNTHFGYIPTYTGPGHASIYTGTTPAVHGIIANNWFDRNIRRSVYVTEDTTQRGVGVMGTNGRMSPSRMLTTTLGDEIRLASNLRSKVVGISLKDRGAILPAGHSATSAYWFETGSGNWITSSFYMNELPAWVVEFNNRKRAAALVSKPWTPLMPLSFYKESTEDDNPYEDLFGGESKPVFPHFLSSPDSTYGRVNYSPVGNTLTIEFALAALQNESLGRDDDCDLLAVSFASPDYVGHQYGTHAIETQDIYLRLDRELADFIAEVENRVGKNEVLFFLTSDHGAIPNVLFLRDQRIPAGIFNEAGISDSLRKYLNRKFGLQKWVLAIDNEQIYLDHQLLVQQRMEIKTITDEIRRFLLGVDGIANVLTAEELSVNDYTWGIRSLVQKGFYPRRSGDLVIILEPGMVEYKSKGTTHGSGYTYDTHVPLIFYGAGIKPGIKVSYTDITDIAPTLSQILGIQPPSGCTGKVIEEIVIGR